MYSVLYSLLYNLRVTFFVLALLALTGCAAVALTAGSMAAGEGINHTLSGITYKTFATPIDELKVATLKTLERLDMPVSEQKQAVSGWEIVATAYDRKIEIELEALTKRATRMRVVANKGEIFFKDAATATEIIIQTAETLAMEAEAAARSKAKASHSHSAQLSRRY